MAGKKGEKGEKREKGKSFSQRGENISANYKIDGRRTDGGIPPFSKSGFVGCVAEYFVKDATYVYSQFGFVEFEIRRDDGDILPTAGHRIVSPLHPDLQTKLLRHIGGHAGSIAIALHPGRISRMIIPENIKNQTVCGMI